MPSVGFADSQDVMQPPITYSEMRALIEPMQNCLQQMEQTIQGLACAWPPAVNSRCTGDRAPDVEQTIQGLACAPPADNSRSDGNRAPDDRDFVSPVNASIGATPADNSRWDGNRAPDDRDFVSPVNASIGATSAPHRGENMHVSKGVIDINKDLIAENRAQFLQCVDINEVLKAKRFSDSTGFSVAQKLASKMERFFKWWHSLEEPERTNSLAYRFGTSRYFDIIAMSIIVFNSGLVAYTADWQIRHLGMEEPSSFEILEKSCLAWFVLELTIRLLAHRHHFFLNSDLRWNIFDLVLVSISVVNFGFEIGSSVDGNNVGFMRALRLLKLAKIFRSMRSFRFVKSLQLFLDSFQKSFFALFWGLVMLAFILYIFSQIFLQAMIEYFTSDHADLSMKGDAMDKFGSLGATLLSLYMAVTGGDDWGNLYSILSEAGAVYGLVLVFFTFFFIFALFNILTALLVEKALTQAKPDRAQVILQERRRLAEQRETFLQVCQAMDLDGDGTISWVEFQEWMCDPVMLSYMSSVGIEIHDVELFFTHVGARAGRDGKLVATGEITIDHFVEGLMHMQGAATSLDMQRQLFEMHLLHFEVKHVHESFGNKIHYLEQLVIASLQQSQAGQLGTATLSRPGPLTL